METGLDGSTIAIATSLTDQFTPFLISPLQACNLPPGRIVHTQTPSSHRTTRLSRSQTPHRTPSTHNGDQRPREW